ncbi:hypothetical protein LQF66_11220, partial [Tetragenococcus halophilus]|nr:hypothetical protein [Tetragenococcus halophilus]
FSIREKISQADKYHKKFDFEHFLKVFLYGIDNECESLREMDTAFVSPDLKQTLTLDSISHSQLPVHSPRWMTKFCGRSSPNYWRKHGQKYR